MGHNTMHTRNVCTLHMQCAHIMQQHCQITHPCHRCKVYRNICNTYLRFWTGALLEPQMSCWDTTTALEFLNFFRGMGDLTGVFVVVLGPANTQTSSTQPHHSKTTWAAPPTPSLHSRCMLCKPHASCTCANAREAQLRWAHVLYNWCVSN